MSNSTARLPFALMIALIAGPGISQNEGAPAESMFIQAVANAPAVTAARLRVDAARSRARASGRFADPQLAGMYAEKQTPDESFPMWEITLEQPLPKAGERTADRRRSAAASEMAQAELALMAGDVAADTAMQLVEAANAHRREALTVAQVVRLERMLAAVDARVAAGQGRATEHLALSTRIADMRLMAERESIMARDAESNARAQLGLDATAPLPQFSAPQVAAITANRAPSVRLAEARARESAAMAAMARASRMPMTAVGLRFEREEMPTGDEDTVGVALMTEIPWRSRGYARSDYVAAEAEREASRADAATTRHAIAALLERVERAEQLATKARDLAAATETRLGAEYDAQLRRAGTAEMTETMPTLMLIEILDKSTSVQLQCIEAEGAARAARAELWRHVPEITFVTTGE